MGVAAKRCKEIFLTRDWLRSGVWLGCLSVVAAATAFAGSVANDLHGYKGTPYEDSRYHGDGMVDSARNDLFLIPEGE